MVNKTLLRYFNLILGAVIAAFALEEFLVPCQILDGGIVGISIIISSLTPISLGILTICLNLPFVLAGAKLVFVDVRPDTMNIDEKKYNIIYIENK